MKRTRDQFEEQRSCDNKNCLQGDWANYILSDGTQVYSGVTNNLSRRLKQHRTHRGALKTRRWTSLHVVAIIRCNPSERYPSKTLALSFERMLKRTIIPGGGIAGRIKAIIKLMHTGFQSKALGQVTADELTQSVTIFTSLSQTTVYQIASVAQADNFNNWVFDAVFE